MNNASPTVGSPGKFQTSTASPSTPPKRGFQLGSYRPPGDGVWNAGKNFIIEFLFYDLGQMGFDFFLIFCVLCTNVFSRWKLAFTAVNYDVPRKHFFCYLIIDRIIKPLRLDPITAF